MTAVGRSTVLGLSLLLAAATAAADVVVTDKETIKCQVVSCDTNFTRVEMPSGCTRIFRTRDVREIRLSDSSHVAELTSRLPQVRVTLDSCRPVAASAASAARNRFISAELFSIGTGPITSGYASELQIWMPLHIEVEFSRVRLGLALSDGSSFLPVNAGYTIYERPVSYAGSLYAKAPEVYVEGTAGFINMYFYSAAEIPFRGTLELVCSVDGYGAGASVAAGYCYHYYHATQGGVSNLYAVVRFHLLRFRLGF